ncbi:type IV toxin-antitoxin system AbiEi family antitoxin domain-containing protein [Microbacterium sp. JZ31]|uniref:type IV toxin-antitoxin system AbiEi family antitoxin domain-containing protein n=1 Tax=Microbacterium sp. JZ31 TaxID=1906274 RepID=UPI0019315677|nr:type IV toxin-antitoxin system AbiEi family antitoxin domain-containing protein [Microbacterium sp. JZ31]
MHLIDYLERRGGIARTRELLDAGFSRHVLARAVSREELRRPRQGWVHLPGTDTMLVRAAVSGVVLSCITQARRLGLWVSADDDVVHVAATSPSSVNVVSAHVHWSRPLIPRPPGRLEDPVENVLAIVADCQPHERALATWDSAFNTGLVDRDSFRLFPLRPAARRLLLDVNPFHDAGTETFVHTRLRWLRIPIRPQVWLYGHRVDFLIGERLVLQIDGGHHIGAQRDSDNAHDAILRVHGYTVIRVSYRQLTESWPEVQDLILRAIAQGLHKAA